MLGSVQICGEKLTSIEIKDMRESLEADNIKLLSLRECKVKNIITLSNIHYVFIMFLMIRTYIYFILYAGILQVMFFFIVGFWQGFQELDEIGWVV